MEEGNERQEDQEQTSMNNLAFTLKGQSCGNDVIALMGKCCQLRERIFGPQHPHTTLLRVLNEWRLEK